MKQLLPLMLLSSIASSLFANPERNHLIVFVGIKSGTKEYSKIFSKVYNTNWSGSTSEEIAIELAAKHCVKKGYDQLKVLHLEDARNLTHKDLLSCATLLAESPVNR